MDLKVPIGEIVLFVAEAIFLGLVATWTFSSFVTDFAAIQTGPIQFAPSLGTVDLKAFATLFFLLTGALACLCAFRPRIRADAEAIKQTTIFRTRTVKWDAVTAYFYSPVTNFGGFDHRRGGLVLEGPAGEILLRERRTILIPATYAFEKREDFLLYVEAQLPGKGREVTPEDADPRELLAKYAAELTITLGKNGAVIPVKAFVSAYLGLSLVCDGALYFFVSTPGAALSSTTFLTGPWLLPVMATSPLLPPVAYGVWLIRKYAAIKGDQKMRRAAKSEGLVVVGQTEVCMRAPDKSAS